MWLKIDNTNIDYPVGQPKDNNNPNSQNLILYGHNMRNDTMFNNLLKFKDKKFFNQKNKIRIIKYDKESIYEIFSAYIIEMNLIFNKNIKN